MFLGKRFHMEVVLLTHYNILPTVDKLNLMGLGLGLQMHPLDILD